MTIPHYEVPSGSNEVEELETIPYSRPSMLGNELEELKICIKNGLLAGGGAYSAKCEARINSITNSFFSKLLNSCSAALETAVLALNIGPGDEVIMPSYTFPSTANAVALRGGIPVFVDIRQDTMNIDEKLIEAAITSRTKSIIVVHYAGVACDMKTIIDISTRNGLSVIEDAAQAFGAYYDQKHLGTFGDMGAFSFHATKNINCGEGGCIVSRRPDLNERIENIIEKGTNRTAFLRRQVDKYTWGDVGSSHVMSEIQAAFLYNQVSSWKKLTNDRLTLWDRYQRFLSRKEFRHYFETPAIPQQCQHNGHIYYVRLKEHLNRNLIIKRLAERGVQATSHFDPLHKSPAGERFGRTHGDLVVSERESKAILRLPLWNGLAQMEQIRVVDELIDICEDCYGV